MSTAEPIVKKQRPRPSRGKLRATRLAVFGRDGWACHYCGLLFEADHDSVRDGTYAPSNGRGEWLELDHVVPYSAGGPFTVDNLRAACTTCNRKKSWSTRYADWPARILRAKHLLDTRAPNKRTAEAVMRALQGEDI